MNRYRSGVLGLLLVTLTGACREKKSGPLTADQIQPIVIKDAGLSTPESFTHDPFSDVYFVTSINGSPLEADNNGYVSVFSAEGDTLKTRWIAGGSGGVTLHAPKGITAVMNYVYVTDINTIRRFDRVTGVPKGDFPVSGATFLNDIAAHENGTVYFTDSGYRPGANGFEASGTDAVYRMTPDGTLDTLLAGTELGHPNGIAVVGDTVWVVSGAGELYRIENGARRDVVKVGHEGLDGLVVYGGDAFISTWAGRMVLRGKTGGPFRPLLTGVEAPADIGHDLWRNRILVPLFRDNELRIVKLVEF